MYMMWLELKVKRDPLLSIQEGVATYMDKFKRPAKVVYVHRAEDIREIQGVQVLLTPPGSLVVHANEFAIGETTL